MSGSYVRVRVPTAATLLVLSLLAAVAVILGTVGISYQQTQAAIHNNNLKLERVSIQSAKRTCAALVALDKSRDGFVIQPNGGASEHALERLFNGIHRVVVSSQCPALLSGRYHYPAG